MTVVVSRVADMSNDEIMRWSAHAEELGGSFVGKARKFLDLECIRYIGDDDTFGGKYTFICLPINTEDHVYLESGNFVFKKPHTTDYNSTTYYMRREPGVHDGETFVCNCQGWHKRYEEDKIAPGSAGCSHTLALYLAFKAGLFPRKRRESQ